MLADKGFTVSTLGADTALFFFFFVFLSPFSGGDMG